MLSRLSYIVVLLLFSSCYNHTTPPIVEPQLPTANISIAELRNTISQGGKTIIDKDVVVVGRVTSSDDDNNFFRSIIVEDDSGGLELMVGIDRLSTTYPEGLQVAVCLNGCALGYRYGILQTGSPAHSYDSYDVDYLASKVDINKVIIRSNNIAPIEPQCKTIAELSEDMCGRYVSVSNLQLVATTSIDTLQNQTLANSIWQGYSLFRNAEQDTLMVYTRNWATYAKQHIPTEPVTIRGIVQYGEHPNHRSYYQLKMRHVEDCTLH